MIVVFSMVAFSVDIGYLMAAKSEIQRTADAAALAGAWELVDQMMAQSDPTTADAETRAAVLQYASMNAICRTSAEVDSNPTNGTNGEIVLGYLDLTNPTAPMDTLSPGSFNAVQVRIRRTKSQNGEIPFFFAPVMGIYSQPVEATATAALATEISGFRTPAGGKTLELLPFALDLESWNKLLAGEADDDWTWDEADNEIDSGPDGIQEVNLYPQGTGSPGNRGTIDIGSSNNSTADIARQILYGISADDLAHHGGSLVFNDYGTLILNGDTGISAGMKDELATIKGQTRIIPIFSQVIGNGNNANYTIVKWAGIRLMDVKLTGPMNQKRVIAQPAPVVIRSAIPSQTTESSDFVITPAVLLR